MQIFAWGKVSLTEAMAGRLITASPTQFADRMRTFFISENGIFLAFPIVE
jgi:hypothetical protein